MKDRYDLLKAIYNARIGVLFIMMKARELRGLARIKIYEVEQNGLKGFIVEGRRNKKYVTEMRLILADMGREIDFYYSGSEPIDDRMLGAIIRSIRKTERSGN